MFELFRGHLCVIFRDIELLLVHSWVVLGCGGQRMHELLRRDVSSVTRVFELFLVSCRNVRLRYRGLVVSKLYEVCCGHVLCSRGRFLFKLRCWDLSELNGRNILFELHFWNVCW